MIRGEGSPFKAREKMDNFLIIEVHHRDTPAAYDDILRALADKANRYRKKIRQLWRQADIRHVEEIQELNQLLYDCNKFRTELEYKKNML